MQRYEELELGIKTKDVKRIRHAIRVYCYVVTDFSDGSLDEMIQYVESKGIRIKEDSLVGKTPVSHVKKEYTEEDFSAAVCELERNFCDERINDVKIIGQALYTSNTSEEAAKEQKSIVEKDEIKESKTGTDPNGKGRQKGIILIALAAVLVIILLGVLKTR